MGSVSVENRETVKSSECRINVQSGMAYVSFWGRSKNGTMEFVSSLNDEKGNQIANPVSDGGARMKRAWESKGFTVTLT